jgi:hypothetical protein
MFSGSDGITSISDASMPYVPAGLVHVNPYPQPLHPSFTKHFALKNGPQFEVNYRSLLWLKK